MDSLNIDIYKSTKSNIYKWLSIVLNSYTEIPETPQTIIRQLFDKNVIAYKNITHSSQISSIHVSLNRYNAHIMIFNLYNGDMHSISIAHVSGKSQTEFAYICSMFRREIQHQINSYRMHNALNSTDICPVAGIPLGLDAEIDHVIPFHILVRDWIKHHNIEEDELPNIVIHREVNVKYKQSWIKYHLDNAQLRYLSYKGNRVAHIGYIHKPYKNLEITRV